jgi:hypothetical protein
MKVDQKGPSRSTWVTLATVLASKERVRDGQNSADKFRVTYTCVTLWVWPFRATTGGTSLANFSYFPALFGGGMGVWRCYEASWAHECERRLNKISLTLVWCF